MEEQARLKQALNVCGYMSPTPKAAEKTSSKGTIKIGDFIGEHSSNRRSMNFSPIMSMPGADGNINDQE